MGDNRNTALNTLGVTMVLVSAALQEFHAYRKEVMSQRRNCNDSRATLLLYLSLGLSLEALGLGVLPLPFYTVASKD